MSYVNPRSPSNPHPSTSKPGTSTFLLEIPPPDCGTLTFLLQRQSSELGTSSKLLHPPSSELQCYWFSS
ncbi:MAG: hypothetical protein WCA35_01990, partial [Kovacikia sp.]